MAYEQYVEIEQTIGDYTIRVRGSTAKDVARQVIEAAKALGATGAKLKAPSTAKSLTEFINLLHPKTDPDRVVCCAYFLQTQRNTEAITTRDLGEAYREAKLPKSSNLSDAVASSVSKGYLAPTGKKKEGYASYYVTSDGLGYVQSGLKVG